MNIGLLNGDIKNSIMTNEQKQILLKDLCGRLPYKTKVFFSIVYDEPVELSLTILRCLERIPLEQNDIVIKPYLCPMSSMTDTEWFTYCDMSLEDEKTWVEAGKGRRFISIQHKEDFLNSHHFDYRGLIEKGLALEAPEDMY